MSGTSERSTNGEPAVPEPRTRLARVLLVIAGIVLGQLVIYGPSLTGTTILLPLDYLAQPHVYLPRTPEIAQIVQHDRALTDLVLQFETDRRFMVEELRAGRFPFWAPYQFAGAPFVWPKYSPFLLFGCLTSSPVILAWAQMLMALVAGLGAYVFLRRTLAAHFWAAAIPAWCYPLTGFFVFWQGFPTCMAIFWLPWLLLAVHAAARQPGLKSVAGLSAATALTLVSGHIDVAGQALLISGFYALWNLYDAHRGAFEMTRVAGAALAVSVSWGLGFALAAPHLLPLLEYAKTGARMTERAAGGEERPPGKPSALLYTVLPDIHGATRTGSLRLAPGVQIESAAAAYAGVLAALLFAPLAASHRGQRSATLFFCAIAIFGLGWSIGLPGLVPLLRISWLKMFSHNRLVFATAFALLALSALALDALARGRVRWRPWFWLPTALLTGLAGWCAWRAIALPEPLATRLAESVRQGQAVQWIRDLAGVAAAQNWFRVSNAVSASLCGLGVVGWLALWAGKGKPALWLAGAGIVMVGDLLWFAHERSAQCDPALYYPRLPVLEAIAQAPPGRVIGHGCLPAQLLQTHGLPDVRGYDSVDPARMVELLAPTAEPGSPTFRYALTEWLIPRSTLAPPDGIRLPPVLDLLGVRYVVFRGEPPAGVQPAFRAFDYWALINHAALPRVFIPARVEMIPDGSQLLARLSAPTFDPRVVAYTGDERAGFSAIRGQAQIVRETPAHIIISAEMETPGLIVLADHWDDGWRATWNGQPVPLLPTNHAVRGAIVPAGAGTLEFRYEPASVAWGFRLAALTGAVFVVAAAVQFWRDRRR